MTFSTFSTHRVAKRGKTAILLNHLDCLLLQHTGATDKIHSLMPFPLKQLTTYIDAKFTWPMNKKSRAQPATAPEIKQLNDEHEIVNSERQRNYSYSTWTLVQLSKEKKYGINIINKHKDGSCDIRVASLSHQMIYSMALRCDSKLFSIWQEETSHYNQQHHVQQTIINAIIIYRNNFPHWFDSVCRIWRMFPFYFRNTNVKMEKHHQMRVSHIHLPFIRGFQFAVKIVNVVHNLPFME